MWSQIVTIIFIIANVTADVYLHNMRGSNNRLDEKGRERANANRLFDSQNNNRGGYNVGSLYYYVGSVLSIEWTNQHSCGQANSHCELILQYMCSEHLRDGTVTTTIPERDDQCNNYDCNRDLEYGMHEDIDYYTQCKIRKRNKRLFTADQNLNNRNAAKNTRQNPAGTRRGLECPEERDYYPYTWGPSPWKDIAVMTNDVSRCPMYQANSANVMGRWYCQVPVEYLKYRQRNGGPLLPLNKEDCEAWTHKGVNGTWTEIKPFGIPPPDCLLSPKSRDNHNGNGPEGFPNMYNWTIPNDVHDNCALRLRYNISTADYERNATADLNGAGNLGRRKRRGNNNNGATDIDIAALVGLSKTDAEARGYVFEGNPVVQPLNVPGIENNKLSLQLAINTAQYGRTFQDRSHSFQIRARTSDLGDTPIKNLNVRGKRGNIVQVYPAVEYDFVPNRLEMNPGEYIHIQWTGSNTNPDNNDGQGLRGTDRSNIALLAAQQYPEGTKKKIQYGHWGRSYPEHLNAANFLGFSRDVRQHLMILSPGQFKGELSELDDAGTYFDLGPKKITSNGKGTYHYMCTRNNNFSNRSQKGKIFVNSVPKAQYTFGWNGGSATLGDGKVGVWIEKGVLNEPVRVAIQEWDSKAGEEVVKQNGGKMDKGSGYESKYLVVEPFGLLANGKEVTVKLKVDSTDADIYYSDDYKNWDEVNNVKFSDGVASFKSHKGGLFVARSNNKQRNLIIGVVVALVVIAALVIGTVMYCRRNPEKWDETKKSYNNMRMGTKSKI